MLSLLKESNVDLQNRFDGKEYVRYIFQRYINATRWLYVLSSDDSSGLPFSGKVSFKTAGRGVGVGGGGRV